MRGVETKPNSAADKIMKKLKSTFYTEIKSQVNILGVHERNQEWKRKIDAKK